MVQLVKPTKPTSRDVTTAPLMSRLRLLLAAGAGVVAVCTIAVVGRRRRRRYARILVAACDLDKTVYPPAGPERASQLEANVSAMATFERLGGFVFPVTGNNPPQAQVKFLDPAGKPLRDVSKHPGIFCNGGLTLGPGGIELERHALGELWMNGPSWERSDRARIDFVTALLDFWDAPAHRPLTAGVGLLFFLPHVLAGYESAYANVEAFCESQNVTPERRSRASLITERDRVLQVVMLFPPFGAAPNSYEEETRPWQLRVQSAMEAAGLTSCARGSAKVGGGGGSGIKIIVMKDPWPEVDVTVGGVDKGSALARFLQRREVCAFVGADHVDPAEHVAVFGDAANDVPMFRAIGGVSPALRVGMPHAGDEELCRLSNVRAQVSQVLELLCEARIASESIPALRRKSLTLVEIAAARLRAFLRGAMPS